MWARSILGLERAKEERLRFFGQELPGFGIEQVQAVVVDDRGLLAEPFLPTDLAYGVVDAVAQLAGEGWAGQLTETREPIPDNRQRPSQSNHARVSAANRPRPLCRLPSQSPDFEPAGVGVLAVPQVRRRSPVPEIPSPPGARGRRRWTRAAGGKGQAKS